jgi:uncharacterized membrane protein
MSVLFFVWIASGLLLIGVSVPLILKKVPPNQWYGFRVPKTLSSDRIWYEANRVAGIDLCLAGGVIIGSSFVMSLAAPFLTPGIVSTAMLLVFIGSLLVAVVHSFLALKKM